MSTAYLTIDDGPTKDTKTYLDWLLSRDIHPVMFFWGDRIKEARENGIYAIKNGAIIGNHTDTHPHFSDLSLEECIREIERQEEAINSLYEEAGVKREYKLFRCPYGDKGGKNKEAIQEYLRSHGFCKLDYTPIKYNWYYDQKLDQDFDTLWTFDYEEYRLQFDQSFSYEYIIKHIADPNPAQGGNFTDPGAHNIVLIHDHPQTDRIVPGYFFDIIERTLQTGVKFIKPVFRSF